MFADSIPGADVRYSWNYGDNSGDVWKDNTDFKKTQIHEYATYGKYTIVLDVNNKHCSTSDTAKITIEPAAPTKTIGAKSNTGCNQASLFLTDKTERTCSIKSENTICISTLTDPVLRVRLI